MPTRQTTIGGRDYVDVDFQLAPLQLNLTALRSALRDGQASTVIGRDVINEGRLAKAPRRKPVAVSIPLEMYSDLDLAQGGHPLTTAIPCNMRGNVVRRQSYNSGPAATPGSAYTYFNRNLDVISMTDAGIVKYADWPAKAKTALSEGKIVSVVFEDHLPPAGGVLPKSVKSFNPVAGRPAVKFGSATAEVDSSVLTNLKDEGFATPEYDDNTYGNFFAGSAANGFNFSLVWQEYYDKRGLWVSNGRKFWLLQNGVYTEYLDLGSTSGALGVEWRGAQISPDVFMFVHPQLPPRIITLGADPETVTTFEVAATKYLAGMLTPDLGQRDYSPAQFNVSSAGTIVPNATLSSGLPTDGIDAPPSPAEPARYRVRIRAVDENTGAVSKFVDAAVAGTDISGDNQAIEVSGTGSDQFLYVLAHIAAHSPTVGNGWVLDNYNGRAQFRIPFKTARATHLEFWRTTKAAISFFKELRKTLTFPALQFFNQAVTTTPNTKYTDSTFSTKITDTLAVFSQDGEHAVLNLPDFDLQRRQLMTSIDERLGGLPPMCRDIISMLGCTLAGGANKAESSLLLQGKRLIWPRISHDGIIKYSEVSGGFLFIYPESFHPSDFITLTRDEDRFQRFVASSDVVLAIYTKGAYRLARNADSIGKKQLAASGIGTPWANAILPAGKLGVWVTPTAIRVYNAEVESGTGDLQSIEHGPMLQWFTDALNAGMQIDAGYDERYGTLHLRRNRVVDVSSGVAGGTTVIVEDTALASAAFAVTEDDTPPLVTGLTDEDGGTVAALEGAKIAYFLDSAAVFNLRTGAWTLIDDDNGFRYVAAENIDGEAPGLGPRLYSIDQIGGVFELNYQATSHPYDNAVQQEVLTTNRYIFSGTEIRTAGGPRFTTRMRGDTVRFRSADPQLDNVVRTIRNADTAKIQFDPLPVPLAVGDEFIIGAVRFRVRLAPVIGSSLMSIKSLDQLQVFARPGPVHAAGAWGPKPTTRMTARVYRDFGNTPHADEGAEIAIFDDDDTAEMAEDRFTSLKAQGRALEIELEDVNARSDFVIDSVVARIEEEGDLVDDQSATA